MTDRPGWTVGDTAPALTGTCSSNGAAADLTGATIEVHVRRPDQTVITRTPTVTDATAGTWSMAWQTGDLTGRGTHVAEVQVTWSDGTIQTFGPVAFDVRGQIA